MKRITSCAFIAFIAFTAIALVGTPNTAFAQALPPCPEDPNVFWHNCFGTYTFGPNSEWAGDKYVGEYKDGKRVGQGTYTFPDGAKYVGEWRDDLKNGVGTLVSPNGTVIHGGLWLNGEPVVKR